VAANEDGMVRGSVTEWTSIGVQSLSLDRMVRNSLIAVPPLAACSDSPATCFPRHSVETATTTRAWRKAGYPIRRCTSLRHLTNRWS
jgi:hypothetical protein